VAKGKRVKTEAPKELSYDERKAIWAWVKEEYPMYASGNALRQMWNRCRTHHQREGNVFADWAAAFENWICKQYELDTGQSAPSGVRGAALARHVEAIGKRNRDGLELIAGGRKP
jgi:hypothetical protein